MGSAPKPQTPVVEPLPDNDAIAAAKKKTATQASQQSGRASTILSQGSSGNSGGTTLG